MSILCVAAHPDDEVLGVGGTLARHAADGDEVHICILSDGVTFRYDETAAADAEIKQRRQRAQWGAGTLAATVRLHGFPDNSFDPVPLLDKVQTIEAEIAEYDPDTVWKHHHGDLKVDHEVSCQAMITLTRPLVKSDVKRVLAFETLCALEWSVPSPDKAFQPTSFVDVSDYLDIKANAISVYQRELRDPPHPRTVEIVVNNAEVWGSKMGVSAAEPFEVLREVRR